MRPLLPVFALALAVSAAGPAFGAMPAGQAERLEAVAAALGSAPMPARVAKAAERFLGAPYAGGLLDMPSSEAEPLVSRIDAFDCVTLVETAIAAARAGRDGEAAFEAELERVRYRGGKRAGYASRLHYFSEWIADNARRGVLKDLTPALGGVPDRRALNFMTAHRSSYAKLGDDRAFAAMRAAEAGLAKTQRHVLPKARLARVLPLLQTGDVVAFATGIEGLDVVHTGLVYRKPSGAVHLLHAPEPGSAVMVSAKTLVEHVMAYDAYTGVMIARPL